MGDLILLRRRQRVLAVVAVLALVAAFTLLVRTASSRSSESVDHGVEDETASPQSTGSRPASWLPVTGSVTRT